MQSQGEKQHFFSVQLCTVRSGKKEEIGLINKIK
jgi:hypothetical protein